MSENTPEHEKKEVIIPSKLTPGFLEWAHKINVEARQQAAIDAMTPDQRRAKKALEAELKRAEVALGMSGGGDVPDGSDQTINPRLMAMFDENDMEIVKIAEDTQLTVEEKMKEICKIDSRYSGYDSPKWAELLAVRPAAIRKTGFWTTLQSKKRAP